MTRAWWRTHWQGVLIAVTACLVAASLGVGLSVMATGMGTNRTVQLQTKSAERSECITAWSTAWSQAIGDVVVTAARGQDPSPAQVDRLEAVQSVDRNAACDPDRDGGVVLPGDS